MQIVSTRKTLGSIILMAALLQGCATTSMTESQSEENILANSSYVADSSNQVVLATRDCVRTINWTAENNVVECNSSAKAPVEVAKVEAMQTMVSFNGRAMFDFDSAMLTDAGQQELNQLTNKLNSQSDIEQIEIVGHTDSVGDEAYNQMLSERRAESVKDYLQQSLRTVSVTAKGMGESSPVANNTTDDGRRLNRRVDVNIAASIAK